MTKKVISVILCALVIMFSGIAVGESSGISIQDELVISFSAGMNAILMDNNQFSKVTYILTDCDFVQDKIGGNYDNFKPFHRAVFYYCFVGDVDRSFGGWNYNRITV